MGLRETLEAATPRRGVTGPLAPLFAHLHGVLSYARSTDLAAGGISDGEYNEAVGALSSIERHVQDMERALEECECLNPIGLLGTGIPCGDWARHTGEVPEGGLCPRCAALSVPAEDAGEPEPTCDECGGPVNARGECRYGHNWPARAALPAREKGTE